jgi:DNA-binding IclR family transcriptional regulator
MVPMSVQPRGWGSPLPHLVQSVQRALRVLEVVAENPDGITAKAVARRLDLALSTTYHLLNTLVAEGYVVRLEGMRGFGLGYKIPTLDRVLRRKLGVSPAVAAAVDDVHRRAGAAAYYAIYRDREVVIAYVADSALTPRVDPLDVGFHQAAHALAFGKVMLASLTPADRREYLSERGLPVFTEHTLTEGARLERDLDEVARLGIGADVEEFQPGLACVAAPVVGGDGAVIGAVSVSVPAVTIAETRQRLESAVREGAARISRVVALAS